ncbi:MAG: hypothetical protein WAK31_18100 [Chthoniobacterales bacterium]
MKRLLSLVLSGAVFTSVIAGALSLSMLRLLQSENPVSPAVQALVSASSTTPPTIVGTDHPVPATPQPHLAASPKVRVAEPPAAPNPQPSALAENDFASANDSGSETKSPVELVREKAELSREKAERLRARVEDLYQSHRISIAAYKQGQAEYRQELANYENQIAQLCGAMTGAGAANE